MTRSRTIRVDLEVRQAIAAAALEGETPNATLRRLLFETPEERRARWLADIRERLVPADADRPPGTSGSWGEA